MVGNGVLQHEFQAYSFRWLEVSFFKLGQRPNKTHLPLSYFFLYSLLISSQGPCSSYGQRLCGEKVTGSSFHISCGHGELPHMTQWP